MRKVLGDALYHVRLPTMSKEEFMEHAAKSDVLSDREARDLLTYYMDTEPARPLQFPENRRLGNAKIVEFPGTSVSTESLNFPNGTYLTLQFDNSTMSGLQVVISEIHFCNPADFPIDEVQVYVNGTYTSCDKVEKIPDKLYCGYPVYRAIFRKPVSYQPYNYQALVHFKTKSYTGVGTGAVIYAGSYYHQFSVNEKNLALTLYGYNSSSWRFLVALKIRVQ